MEFQFYHGDGHKKALCKNIYKFCDELLILMIILFAPTKSDLTILLSYIMYNVCNGSLKLVVLLA